MPHAPVPRTPVANTRIAVTAASFERCDLPERGIMLARTPPSPRWGRRPAPTPPTPSVSILHGGFSVEIA
jgi:hypothetical protein